MPILKVDAVTAFLVVQTLMHVDRNMKNEIPWGYRCTACGAQREHRDQCWGPRGLQKVK
jgi:rRNA maturation endonuclease Nob1